MATPAHMSPHPTVKGFVWDTNFGKYIADPGMGPNQIPYNLGLTGFMQTPQAQADYSNTLMQLAQPTLNPPLNPPGGQASSMGTWQTAPALNPLAGHEPPAPSPFQNPFGGSTASPVTAPPPAVPMHPTGPPPVVSPPVPPPGNLANTVGNVNTNVPTTDLINQVLTRALDLSKVEGRGLSPAALAMMRTQAIEEVPARFDKAAADLMTSLRRRNAGLPAGGTDIRNLGQFAAAREATRAGLLRDVVMADEAERVRSREADRAFGLQALNLAGNLATGRGNLELGISELGQRMDLAQLDADTRTRLAQMGIDSNEKLATLDANVRRELSQAGIDANLLMSKLDNETRIKIAELQSKGDSIATRIVGSIGSSLLNNPKVQGAVNDGIGWVVDRITGKSVTQVASTALGGAAAGTLAGTGGGAATGVASAGPIGSATGFGTKLAAFATNPFTIGIAATAAAGFLLYKKFGTDHLRANELVQKFQNPFADTFITPMHQEFFRAAEQGKMNEEQAKAARSEFVSGWEEYVRQIRAWAGDNGSKVDVMNQSINTLWPLVQRIVGDMDGVIQRGGYDYAMGVA